MSRFNVVCIDACKYSLNAFHWYLNNYHRQGDVVGLLHVHQTPGYPTLGIFDGGMMVTDEYSQLIQDSLDRSKTVREKYETLCKDNGIEFKLLMADDYHSIGQVLCNLAKENNADVIICGKRGLGTFSRALLGSTSDYVVHHSHVPVVVVPPSYHD